MRVGATVLFVALLGTARADSQGAQAHFDRGSKLYQQGRYDDALAELSAGYEMDPRPDFLYSLGQTERKRGHCKEALDYYQRYLDSGLPRERAAAVLVQMDRCRAELERPPPPAPVIVVAPPPVLVVAPPPPRKPVYKRWWLWTTVVVVAAGVGVGLGVGLTQGRSDFKSSLPDLVLK